MSLLRWNSRWQLCFLSHPEQKQHEWEHVGAPESFSNFTPCSEPYELRAAMPPTSAANVVQHTRDSWWMECEMRLCIRSAAMRRHCICQSAVPSFPATCVGPGARAVCECSGSRGTHTMSLVTARSGTEKCRARGLPAAPSGHFLAPSRGNYFILRPVLHERNCRLAWAWQLRHATLHGLQR
jgi:hypothetical protein